MDSSTSSVYHERQVLYRCGIHALNNALQAHVFDTAAMENACSVLVQASADASQSSSWLWHPHRAPLKLGNYDVNVLMYVLQERGYQMQWLDKRQPITSALVDLDRVEGVLCNVVTSNLLSALWQQRHWFAIRKIGGLYYNLDSKLAAPMAFASEGDCFQFLQELVDTGECELFSISKTDQENSS